MADITPTAFGGPLLIGAAAGWLLFGCFGTQLYYYYMCHGKNDRWLKLLVAVAALAVSLHIGFATITAWMCLVQKWGNINVYGTQSPWESGLGPLTSALNGFIVQTFFVSRIFFISKHIAARISAGLILLASLLALGGSMTVMILFLQDGSDGTQLKRLQTGIRLWIIPTVFSDILIAATMSIILRHVQSKIEPHLKNTQYLLTRLICQSIETGSITAINMLLSLICYETFAGKNTSYVIWDYMSGPLYGNVLLFVLNSRHHLRTLISLDRVGNDTSSSRDEEGRIQFGTLSGLSLDRPGIASVKVTTDVLKQYDNGKEDLEVRENRYSMSRLSGVFDVCVQQRLFDHCKD